MKKLLAAILLIASGFVVSNAAMADDAEIAAKLKGEWKGTWVFSGNGFSDRFSLNVAEVEGTTLKGESTFFGTMQGDQKLPILKGEVKDGKILIEQLNTKLALKLEEKNDKSKLTGDWTVDAYSGTINAKKD